MNKLYAVFCIYIEGLVQDCSISIANALEIFSLALSPRYNIIIRYYPYSRDCVFVTTYSSFCVWLYRIVVISMIVYEALLRNKYGFS